MGRRGACLALLALLEILIGFSVIASPPENLSGLPLVDLLSPLGWGIIQIAFAVAAMFFVFSPALLDMKGFTLVLIPPTLWFLAWLSAAAFGETAVLTAMRQCLLWFGYTLMIFVVSGMVGARDVIELTKKPSKG